MELQKERLQNNFDLLRLFAAICITFTHSFNLLQKNASEPLMKLSAQRYDFSFIGLCIFFSISGYLITKSSLSSRSVLNYCWKRLLRIQPLLLVVCIFSIFIIGPLFTKSPLPDYFKDLLTYTYFRNIFPATGIQYNLPGVFTGNIAEASVNGSLWTLVVEERLYLFILIFMFFSIRRKIIFLTIIGVADLIYLVHGVFFQHNLFPYLETANVFYALIFLNAGASCMLNINFKKLQNLFTFLILSAAVFAACLFSKIDFLQIVLIPLIVITIAYVKGATNRVGRWGDFTYGIYIFSFPVQQIFIALNACKSNPIILFIETIAVVVPLAILSWHLIEKRFLSIKNLVA